MMDDIYNSRILEFAGNIPRIGALPDADAEAQAHSKLCGSKVRVYIKMDGDVVSDFSHELKACALGQASRAAGRLRARRRDRAGGQSSAGLHGSGRFGFGR